MHIDRDSHSRKTIGSFLPLLPLVCWSTGPNFVCVGAHFGEIMSKHHLDCGTWELSPLRVGQHRLCSKDARTHLLMGRTARIWNSMERRKWIREERKHNSWSRKHTGLGLVMSEECPVFWWWKHVLAYTLSNYHKIWQRWPNIIGGLVWQRMSPRGVHGLWSKACASTKDLANRHCRAYCHGCSIQRQHLSVLREQWLWACGELPKWKVGGPHS